MFPHRFLIRATLSGFGGFLLLLILLAGRGAPAAAAGAIIHVPDDYPTIQAAIDAAQAGDTIRVVEDEFTENVIITKALTLSGGWNAAFDQQTGQFTLLDGQGAGRTVSIITAGPEQVIIEHFALVGGDATGQGGAGAGVGAGAGHNPGWITPTVNLQQVLVNRVAAPAALRSQLAESAAASGPPAVLADLRAVTARLDHWDNMAAHYATLATNVGADDPTPDCGGGLNSRGAALWLHHNVVEANVASRSGDGYGGGVCVVDAPAGAVRLEHNLFAQNIASLPGEGLGGGLYLSNVPSATVTANQFVDNIGTAGGDSGEGGGAFAINAAGLELVGNEFQSNAASLSPVSAHAAAGGGFYAIASDALNLTANQFHSNLAGLYGGGLGGAVYLFRLQDARVDDNTIADNWGAVYAFVVARGGGIGLGDVAEIELMDNRITGNIGGFVGADNAIVTVYGGGVFAATVADVLMTGNTISSNVGAVTSAEFQDVRGGGLAVDTSRSGPSTGWRVIDNTFDANVMLAQGDGGATGGGARLTIIGSLVQGNTLRGNRACSACTYATSDLADQRVDGLLVEGALESSMVSSGDATIDANFIVPSQAGPHLPGAALHIATTDGFTLTNNVVAGHDAGLVARGGYMLPDTVTGLAVNNTFVNRTTGVYVDFWGGSPVQLINNIVVSHSVGITVGVEGSVTLDYTLFDGNDANVGGAGVYTSTNAVAGAPAFVNPADSDFDLLPWSAAIDAGDPAGVPPAPPADILGTPRPQLARVDIGAYEARISRAYLPVISSPQPCAGRTDVGWVVGDPRDGYGMILHTIDGGATWQRQGAASAIPNMILQEASALDAQNVWVVGHQVILRSRDGGQTWENQALPAGLPPDFELHSIKALNQTTAYAVGTGSTLLQTIDGATWTQMPAVGLPPDVGFQTVDAVDGRHVWATGAVGARVRPLVAFYDGAAWREQPVGAFVNFQPAFIGVSAVDVQHVWVVGGFGMPLVYTHDGGATWLRSPTDLSPGDMNRVVAVDMNTGWVAGDYGAVNYTTDSGVTWRNAVVGGGYLFGITAINDKVAWVVGTAEDGLHGLIGRTCNAADWEIQADPAWPAFKGISFVGARR